MRFELFIAFRYLRARRKQVMISFITLISVLGVTTGVAALITILSMYAGMSQDLQKKLLGATAHITLVPKTGVFMDAEKRAAQVAGRPGVVAASPVAYVHAMAGSGGAATGLVLKGVVPGAEKAGAAAFANLKSGRFEDLSGGRRILLGSEAARRLGVTAGSPVTLIIPKGVMSPMGLAPKIHRFTVAGVFETGLFDFDGGWAYVSLDQARRMAGLPAGSCQALEVRVRDIYAVAEIEGDLRESMGGDVDTQNWIEANKPLFSALKLEKWGMFLAIGLIVLVAALNIVTTLVMMVMEKGRDIAILRAMGARTRQIVQIFMCQGLVIGAVGTSLGAALGVGLSLLCDRYKWIHLDSQVYAIPYLPFHVRALDVVLVMGAAMAVSFLATLYPSRRAAAVDPVEAIRYG